ncbi:fecR protein [bacterium BMS3Abin07]|nr:fecR protein [bacterium BMS3Abin07]GBE33065.1 fecR protein [bacterium BMS3Bbin05]HDO21837.1 hypothetical protein [Nitrospirota bacterium]HDZ87398.1 hypothetical protein [Nitrospirota bacterium]
MKKGKLIISVSCIVFLSVTLFFVQSSALAAVLSQAGEVIPGGTGGLIKTNKVVTPLNKTQPLFLNSTYSTGEGGSLSFNMKDGTRLKLGSNGNIYISGKEGKYYVKIVRGKLVFNVPKDSIVIVKTPDYNIEAPYDMGSYEVVSPGATREAVIGFVSYNGTDTRVVSNKGAIKIGSMESGAEVMKVSSGKGVLINTQTKGNRKVMSVHILEQPTRETTGLSTTKKALIGVGGAVIVGGVLMGISGGGGGSQATASQYTP